MRWGYILEHVTDNASSHRGARECQHRTHFHEARICMRAPQGRARGKRQTRRSQVINILLNLLLSRSPPEWHRCTIRSVGSLSAAYKFAMAERNRSQTQTNKTAETKQTIHMVGALHADPMCACTLTLALLSFGNDKKRMTDDHGRTDAVKLQQGFSAFRFAHCSPTNCVYEFDFAIVYSFRCCADFFAWGSCGMGSCMEGGASDGVEVEWGRGWGGGGAGTWMVEVELWRVEASLLCFRKPT